MVNYQGKKIVVIGLGITGLSCINFFLARGVIPRVIDTRPIPPNLDKLPKQVEYSLSGLNENWLLSADLIVVSPGIKLMHPIFNKIIKKGIEIIGDIELFCREAEAPIVSITGSNGKSTVATLLFEMAKSAGINVGIGGNIGLPALNLLNTPYQLYILELSSFQLETTFSLCSYVATILNVTEDHMDRYPLGLHQYRAVKLRIYEKAKICVVNADDILTMPMKSMNKFCISFGTNIGDYCLYHQNGETWICIEDKKIMNTKEISLFGQYNHINILAALALSDISKLPRESSLKTLTTFSGLSHRFQLVLERNGVRWINNSKSTNVNSTGVVLNNLHTDGTLHLLLGGDGKSADFSLLKPYFLQKRIRLYCFGKDSQALSTLCPEITKQTENLEQAMRLLVQYVKPGDTVLLSPACSSLDQFQNFEQRGNLFTHLARELG